MISGSFLSIEIWNPWKEYFEFQGYEVLLPPWPHKSGNASELQNRHPNQNTGLATLTLDQLVEHYAAIARRMPVKPIVLGHSMGGLITQILVNRGFTSAGVAIHSFPPLGVVPFELSFYRAGWKALGLFTAIKQTYMMSFSDWQYAFTNGMSLQQQHESYKKYAIPESKTVARGALTKAAAVDFNARHVPLLFTSGASDNIIPASLNKRNFLRYTDKKSVTDYKVFEGHNHFILGQQQWKEEAGFIAKWIEHVMR